MNKKIFGNVAIAVAVLAMVLSIIALAKPVFKFSFMGVTTDGVGLFDDGWDLIEGNVADKRNAILGLAFVGMALAVAAGALGFLTLLGKGGNAMLITGLALCGVALLFGIIALVFNGQLNDMDWLVDNGYNTRLA